jgi:hypothetical protein
MKATARRRVAFTDKNVIHILHPGYGRDSSEGMSAQLRLLLHEQCRLVREQRALVAELAACRRKLERLTGKATRRSL